MLNAEFVREMAALATQAADPLTRIVKLPGDAPHAYRLMLPDGTFQKAETVAPRERSVSLSIPSLCSWLKEPVEAGNLVAVWYSRAGVVAVDESDTARTTLTLTPSAPLALLADIAKSSDGRQFEQVALWRLLRTTFRDCLPSHTDLKDRVGRVDVKKAQEAAGTVDRKGTSVSRKLMAEASGADQLPEVLTFRVMVFAEASAPAVATVRAAFDFDATAERFTVCVLPGEIEAAFAAGEQWLANLINQEIKERGFEGIPVYHGRPE